MYLSIIFTLANITQQLLLEILLSAEEITEPLHRALRRLRLLERNSILLPDPPSNQILPLTHTFVRI